MVPPFVVNSINILIAEETSATDLSLYFIEGTRAAGGRPGQSSTSTVQGTGSGATP